MVLALVLGAITETNLRQALIIDNNNFGAVISHPISAVILVLAVLLAFGTPSNPDHKTVGKKESVTGVDLMYDRAVPGYIK